VASSEHHATQTLPKAVWGRGGSRDPRTPKRPASMRGRSPCAWRRKEATATRFASKCRERSAKARAGSRDGVPCTPQSGVKGRSRESLATYFFCKPNRRFSFCKKVARKAGSRGLRSKSQAHPQAKRWSTTPNRGVREGNRSQA
jgi:hypothetical protein